MSLDTVDRDKFVYFYETDFFPVTNMYGDEGEPVTDPARAWRAVVYLGPDEWLPTRVTPGEIELRSAVEARLRLTILRAP